MSSLSRIQCGRGIERCLPCPEYNVVEALKMSSLSRITCKTYVTVDNFHCCLYEKAVAVEVDPSNPRRCSKQTK
ncbi:hypothetical protein DPMN_169328 [Dreissena polymorpha]|uniref:Uncharacterized protein n=1 Tax=Dreissena polymorpha TaxID=45954 RepID=A0A9D4F1C3_DREPO|nr:hypothetical protein DPMN_167754 [Dreissena polymorpha]KAH3791116.1 hypothetical protein DPMN_169328 [Dreissena polymorpha]